MTTTTKPTTWGGIAAIAVGMLLALAGFGALAVTGGDDGVASGRHALDSRTPAIVSAALDTGVDDAFGPHIGVRSEAAGGRPLFVGIGRRADVDAYLHGVARTEVTDFEVRPFRVARHDVPGDGTPARPADQRFWVASDTGPGRAEVDWKLHGGDYRVVVMNADGSRGVHTVTRVRASVLHLSAIAGTVAGLGLLSVIGGVALVTAGGRRPRD